MSTILGFMQWNSMHGNVEGEGQRVGLPMVDAAEGSVQFVYPPVVEMTYAGRTDGEPILYAMRYNPDYNPDAIGGPKNASDADPSDAWIVEAIYMDNPDLNLNGVRWANTTDVQLAVATYKGKSVYMAVKVKDQSPT